MLDREYAGVEGSLKVARTFVDSGYMTSVVYEYCRRTARRGRFAIKGYGGVGKALIYRRENHKGLTLMLLGVNEGKAMVYNRMRVRERGAQYCHFGRDDEHLTRQYDESYFRQLNSERAVRKRSGGMMYAVYEPVSKHIRTESLDCRVYALAAYKTLESRKKSERKVRSVEAGIW